MEEWLYLVIGAAIGAAAVYLLLKAKLSAVSALTSENQRQAQQLEDVRFEQKQQFAELQQLHRSNSRLEAEKQGLQEKLTEKVDELKDLHRLFKAEFQNLSQNILDSTSKKFTEQNLINLRQILEPLGQRIEKFEQRVGEAQKENVGLHEGLKEQVRAIRDLGLTMSKEAETLSRALKGDTKAQGNWGEFILERILESSGLERGREFIVQSKDMPLKNEEGRVLIPDVVVKLPEERHLVVDSKVSLLAYEAYCASEEAGERGAHLKKHLESLRSHIKGLGDKHYTSAAGLNSPDFVMLFIPIEACFSLALQNDSALYELAWSRKIVLVSPTTLLATLRTVSSIWKYEKQTRNAMEIARLGGLVYDSIHQYVEEFEKVGRALDGARTAYDSAQRKLTDGGTSLTRRAGKLHQLGVKSRRGPLPNAFLNEAEEDCEPDEID